MQRVKQQVSKWVGLVSWWRSCATPTDSMRQSHTDDPVPLPPPPTHTRPSPHLTHVQTSKCKLTPTCSSCESRVSPAAAAAATL